MKAVIIVILISVTVLILSSCSDAVSAPQYPEDLQGTWVLKGYENDTITVMQRSGKLDEDKYGFVFQNKGKFVERKNNSWCGTPPVVYANYDGTWKADSDNIVDITVGYWGGITEHKIKILSLTKSELKYDIVQY